MIYEAIDRWNDPDAYLEHYGVKGMKWGVRKIKETAHAANPVNHFKASEVSKRINAVAKDKDRISMMSKRQRKSLKNAQSYWNARAKGSTNLPKRNFIKREADRFRSYTAGQRLAGSVGTATVSTVLATYNFNRVAEALGTDKRSYLTSVATIPGSTAVKFGSDWVLNRIFGHF